MVHIVGKRKNELDDALCGVIPRCGLCAEHEGAGREVYVGLFVQQVLQAGYEHGAHELALILVQTLYLHIQNCIRVEDKAVLLAGEGCEILLV